MSNNKPALCHSAVMCCPKMRILKTIRTENYTITGRSINLETKDTNKQKQKCLRITQTSQNELMLDS